MGNIETLQPETLAFFGKRHLPLLEPNSCFSRPDPFEAGVVPEINVLRMQWSVKEGQIW